MYLIRADGNARIGAGHLMRCMAIGEELARLQGREAVCFVCADHQSAALAGEHGFQSRVLGTDYRNMESELPLWQRMVSEPAGGEDERRPVLVIDSYHVTDWYLEALGQYGAVVLMDDMGEHCYPVDCVVNYNAQASLEAYERLYQGRGTRLLIGSRYVPLRRQVAEGPDQWACGVSEAPDGAACGQGEKVPDQWVCGGVSEAPVYCRPVVRNVLITTGGGDSENIAGEILKKLYSDKLVFHLVIGQFHPRFQEMKHLESIYGNIFVHVNVSDMAGLMRTCDLAVTAGGSTIYELAAVGVPFICFSYARNQEPLTEYIGRKDIAGFAGPWHRSPEKTMERIATLFDELTGSKRRRETYVRRERAMTDGLGAERLAKALAEGGNRYEKS